MTSPDDRTLSTDNVHADRRFGVEHGAIHKPIHPSVQYGFERVEDLIGVFQGTYKGGYNYARQGTPTTAALEAKITGLEQGLGTVSFSTGMAAITAIFLTLLRAGDHIVASRYVFGNTNSLLGTIEGLGIAVSKVDACAVAAVEAALRPNTRMVFVETVANPGTQIPDLVAIGELCRARGLLYVVDNTVTSPALFRPREVGAGLVINSLTKTIAGHGVALGGALTDTGLFDWQAYPNIFEAYRKGDARQWGLQQIRKKALRDMGGTLSSEQAHRISVGAETLSLRVRQTSATALALARALQAHPKVGAVHYPFLESHPQHALAKRLFGAGSWLLSFELRDPGTMIEVINRLQLPIKATGLGDTRTLIIPVAPTIFWEAGPQARAEMGIADGLIRVSVGLEDEGDLLADFQQALA
jgi:O-acetylhomoserine (thiol)-lyase